MVHPVDREFVASRQSGFERPVAFRKPSTATRSSPSLAPATTPRPPRSLRDRDESDPERRAVELAQRGWMILDVSLADLEAAESAFGAFHPTAWHFRNACNEARRSWERLRAELGTKTLEAALNQPPLAVDPGRGHGRSTRKTRRTVLIVIAAQTYCVERVAGTELAPIQWRMTRLHPRSRTAPITPAASPTGRPSATAPSGPTRSRRTATVARRIASTWRRSPPCAGFDLSHRPVGQYPTGGGRIGCPAPPCARRPGVERQPVDSSLIRSVGYDLIESTLEIEFVVPGRLYEFFDVPFSVYSELMEAESKGSYFNDFIKDLYAHRERGAKARRPPRRRRIMAARIGRIEAAGRLSSITRISMIEWSKVFADALPYASFLDKYASPSQRTRWDAMHGRFALTADQRDILGGFARRMPVLCLTGGVVRRLHQPVSGLRSFRASFARHRPALPRPRRQSRGARGPIINGGHRVPVVVFLSEDGYEVSRYGERPLSTYRRMAAEQLGPACPTGFVPPAAEALAAVTAEWLDEFELAQLILRLSPRLRALHGD